MSAGHTEREEWILAKRFFLFVGIVLAVVAILAIVYQAMLVSLLMSFLFTYLIGPSVDWMERKTNARRTVLILGLITAILGVVGFCIASLMPAIYSELLGLLKLVPEAIRYMIERVGPLKKLIMSTGFIDQATIDAALSEIDVFYEMSSQAKGMVQKVWETTPTVIGGAMNIALIPVLTFFLLNDWGRLRTELISLVPADLREPVREVKENLDRTLKSVLKGQVTVAAILGVLYMAGLSIVKLDGGLAIGAIAGFCRIVPYLDVVVGVSLSLLVIVTQNLGLAPLMGVGIVFLIVQLLDGMLITPRVIGERAGLHPAVVLASVIAFGDWLGFFGILIAIPVVATVKVLIRSVLPFYRVSPVFLGREPSNEPIDGDHGLS